MRFFNTAGPIKPDMHYYVPPLERLDFDAVMLMIEHLILWPAPSDARPDQAVQKVVIEYKMLHKSLEQTVREGLEQTRAYMDRCAATKGHLVIFDRTADKSWDEKIFRHEENRGDTKITVWGM